MNEQPIEKKEHRLGGVLDVHSIFYTLQGEGIFSGYPATFIRLAGCNLQCPGCDTEYTQGRKLMNPTEIINAMTLQASSLQRLVVITGGEPMRQDLYTLLKELLPAEYVVQVETNGTYGFSSRLRYWLRDNPEAAKRLHVVCSPKAGKVNKPLLPYISAFKYVLQAGKIDKSDGLPTSILESGVRPARPPVEFTGRIYITPYDDGQLAMIRNSAAVRDSALEYGYIAGIQLHKYLGVE